jgi:hypothetical protein
MRQFYEVTTQIRDYLLEDSNVNTVALISNSNDVDFNKQTIFPLSIIVAGDSEMNGSTITMNFSIIAMDLVDINKDKPRDESEPFYGTTDLQDIWNTQHAVLNRLTEKLRRTNDLIQLEGNPTASPFKDRYENLLAGWAMDISLTVPNTEICV